MSTVEGKSHKPDFDASKYHPAIEGLRAIAVLSVVLAHALVPGFSGGFIGVDVFFVISGFLICRLLFDEIEREGRIHLVRFWARRVRRLLPNATLTLFAVLLIGIVLIPGYMRAGVGQDVAMSALQVSNFHFALSAVDYFRQDDPQSPVLHFWSLAVEEQFYVVWPALLAMLCGVLGIRAAIFVRLLLVIVCAASMVGMLQAITISQPVAFFHSWARAWQLGIGGLLAVAYKAGVGRAGSRFVNPASFAPLFGVLGWVGLGVIITSIRVLDESTLYPGMPAMLPTFGTAAILAGVTLPLQKAWGVGVLLTANPLRWLGARSYGWYLWHWPMLIFIEMLYPSLPGVRIVGAAAGLAAACVVFKFVEDPIRRGDLFPMPHMRVLLTGLASILLVVAAAAGFARAPSVGDDLAAARSTTIEEAGADLGRVYQDKCHLDVEATKQPDCEYGKVGGRPRVVLFGDSHAAQWFAALEAAAASEGWSMRSWTKSSCPVNDIRVWYPPRRAAFHECDSWREAIMAELTGPNRPDVVVLSSLQDYTGWLEKPGEPGSLLRKDEAEPIVRAGLERTLRRLVDADVTVIVVRDTPRMIKSFAQCYVGNGGSSCDLIRERALPKPWIDVEVARSFGVNASLRLLDLTDQICEPYVCRLLRDGQLIWRDSHHIRASFAMRQSSYFRRILAEIAANKR